MPAPKDPIKMELFRKKASNAAKKRWSDPEELKKASDRMKKRFKDPIEGEKLRHIRVGTHHSESSRLKSSLSHMGEKSPMFGKRLSDKQRDHLSKVMSGGKNPMFGKHHTDETRKKISDSLKGEKNHRFGKHLSDDECKNLRDINVGKTISKKQRIKISMTFQGISDIKEWCGFTRKRLYCKLFTNEFKLRQYESSNYTCILCGKLVNNPHCHHVYEQKSACCQKIDDGGNLYFMIRGQKIIPNIISNPYDKNKELEYGLNKFAVLCSSCHGRVRGQKNGKSFIDYIRDIENIINNKYNGRSYYTREEYWGNGYYIKNKNMERYYDAITNEIYGKSLNGLIEWGLPRQK